jgi:hypothetical protein
MTEEEYKAEAIAFREAHPEYEPTAENHKALFARLREDRFGVCNRETLAAAYEELKREGKM